MIDPTRSVLDPSFAVRKEFAAALSHAKNRGRKSVQALIAIVRDGHTQMSVGHGSDDKDYDEAEPLDHPEDELLLVIDRHRHHPAEVTDTAYLVCLGNGDLRVRFESVGPDTDSTKDLPVQTGLVRLGARDLRVCFFTPDGVLRR